MSEGEEGTGEDGWAPGGRSDRWTPATGAAGAAGGNGLVWAKN